MKEKNKLGSFHLKYRSSSLKDIVGNEGTVKVLQSILNRDISDRPHVFLFSGPRGCGKTTMARIMAKEFGISELNLEEIDSGSERGVDTADNIKNSLLYSPMGGEAKGYILDEVHATSNKFQEALLKSLEDTPSHVYFFLCTTDPEKVIKSIRDRCFSFSVSLLGSKDLRRLLESVIVSEHFNDFPKKVVEKISEMEDISPRQALVLLDKVFELETEEEMLEVLVSNLRIEETILSLCRTLLNSSFKWSNVQKLLINLEEDSEKVRIAVFRYMSSVLLKENRKEKLNRAYLVMECFGERFFDGKASLVKACYDVFEGE